ncbi:MAG: hypothetical protein JW874_14690 [Spirochaetales bacterium]|nr:hypothetical protein [Spirochaetales bacterium]
MKKKLLMPSVLLAWIIFACTLGIDPDSEEGDWSNAGVQGGIPDYPAGVDVTAFGAAGNGTTDDTQAILDAIDACPEQHAVFLPAGTYLTTGTISIMKSIVLRGEGPGLTLILQDHGADAIEITSGGDRAGIEDLHLHTSYTSFSGYAGIKIYMFGVQNSWVRNIETSGYAASAVMLQSSSCCEVRDSYFHHSREDTETIETFSASGTIIGGNGLDGEGEGCYYNLIENNIHDWFRRAMIIGCLSSNNVYAYNFAWNNWSTAGGGVSSTTDFEIHHIAYGHPEPESQHTSFTLSEGNLFEQAGEQNENHHHNIHLRNRINNGGIEMQDYHQAIGNEFVGQKHPGTWFGNYLHPKGDIATMIIHGNYETEGANPGISWDPAIADHTIPDSYYLTEKPDWFGDLDWPCYGGDLMPGNTRRNPAEVRYWTMLFPETAPTGLQAVVQGNDIELSWTHSPNTQNPSGDIDFIVCRSSEGSGFYRVGETWQTSFTDTPDKAGQYRYYVRARNHLGGRNYYNELNGPDLGGESDPSETITAAVQQSGLY